LELRTTRDPDLGSGAASAPQKARSRDASVLETILVDLVGTMASNVALNLVARYGSLRGVLDHFRHTQRGDPDVPSTVGRKLSHIALAIDRVLRFQAFERPVISTANTVISCLANEMASLRRETFRVLFLDAANGLIADEVLSMGSVARVHVYPREVARRALETDAAAVILIHNHPSGDPQPSPNDIAVTRRIEEACALIDVVVHDHVIIAAGGFFSFGANEMMASMRDSGASGQTRRQAQLP
jgi:DNA repair protein RadC